MGNGNRRVNMMQKLCTHVYKQKWYCWNYSSIGWRVDKASCEGVNSSRYIWYLVRTFINATLCPHPVQGLKKEKEKRKSNIDGVNLINVHYMHTVNITISIMNPLYTFNICQYKNFFWKANSLKKREGMKRWILFSREEYLIHWIERKKEYMESYLKNRQVQYGGIWEILKETSTKMC
jgi:hypothetical protein